MKRTKICTIALLIIVAFILCNSLIPGETSNAISDRVTAIVGGTVPAMSETEVADAPWLTAGTVRKLAHIAEFAALGLTAALLVLFRGKRIGGQLPNLILLGLGVGIMDETIQIFTNRTSMIEDVWIDLLGFGLGLLLLWLVSAAIRHKKGARPQ
ncbi:MAG: VanZ family protein [Oscillospiraceae bacterium]